MDRASAGDVRDRAGTIAVDRAVRESGRRKAKKRKRLSVAKFLVVVVLVIENTKKNRGRGRGGLRERLKDLFPAATVLL